MEPPTKERIRVVTLLLVKTVECPICLEVLNDPLATSCHHRFCRVCIEKALTGKYKIPCPLCNAVVTKRSLNKSENFAEIVEKVKKLSDAIRQDTGLDVTPERGPRTTSVDSPESRSSLEIFNLLHPSPLKTHRLGVTAVGSTKEAPKRKRRAASVSSMGDTAKPPKQIRSGRDLQDNHAGGSGRTAQDKFTQPAQSTSSVVMIESDIMSETNTARHSLQNDSVTRDAQQEVEHCNAAPCSNSVSSYSTRHVLLHRENNDDDLEEVASQKAQSENPIPVRLSTANKKDYTRHSMPVSTASVSSTEKVSNWLQEHIDNSTHDSVTEVPGDPKQRPSENPAMKQTTSRFFSLKALGKTGSPGGRRKFLDVSDSDPYKFIPSQKTAKSAGRKGRPQKGRRKLSAKPKLAQRSNKLGRTSKITEEADLELMNGQKEKAAVDPSELEVELFVTPVTAVQHCKDLDDVLIPSREKRGKKRLSVSARRSRTLKDYMQLDAAEKEANKLQKMISEAQSFELTVSKSPPRKERKLPEREMGVALKDVSNLRAEPAPNVPTSFPVSPLRRAAPHSGLQKPGQKSVVRSQHDVGIRAPEESTCTAPAAEVQKKAEEQVKSNTTSTESVVCLEGEALEGCLHVPEPEIVQPQERDKETGAIPLDNAIVKETYSGSNACTDATSKLAPAESLGDAVVCCAAEMSTTFKKPCRVTFDISAETEDLRPLAAADVNTLEFMNDVCNDVEHPCAYSEVQQCTSAMGKGSVDRMDVETVKELPYPARGKDRTDMDLGKNKNGMLVEESVEECIAKVTTEHRGIMTSQPPSGSTECCPNCKASLVISYTDGQISVTLAEPVQKLLLVDRGMCTEKPGTRVIICKEAVTQTEKWEIVVGKSWLVPPITKQSSTTPLSCNLESSSVPLVAGQQTPGVPLCTEHHNSSLQSCTTGKTPPKGGHEACRMPNVVPYSDPDQNCPLPQQNHVDMCFSADGISQQHESRIMHCSAEKNETYHAPDPIPQDSTDLCPPVQNDNSSCHEIDNTQSQNGYKANHVPDNVPQRCTDCSLSQAQGDTHGPCCTSVGLIHVNKPDRTSASSVPQAQEEKGAQHKNSSTIADIESDDVMSGSDILCRETQDHTACIEQLQEKHSEIHLATIVEDTDESDYDATSPSSAPNCDSNDVDNRVVADEDCEKTPADEDVDHEGCRAKNSLQESQLAASDVYNETIISDLPDVSECLNEHNECGKDPAEGVASITQLSSRNIESCRSASCVVVEQRKASQDSHTEHIHDLEHQVNPDHNDEDKATRKNEMAIDISSSHSQTTADNAAELVPHSAAIVISEQTPEKRPATKESESQEQSPDWSPPIALPKRRLSARSLFGSGWQKADSCEDQLGETKESSGRRRSQQGKRKSGHGNKRKSSKFRKLVVDLECSDEEEPPILVDPITESEANEILQRALANDEDSPDEAALNFARKAIAPLKCSASGNPWTRPGSSRSITDIAKSSQTSSTKEMLPSASHQTVLPAAIAAKSTSEQRSQLSNVATASFVGDGEGSENMESRIATTISTASCLVDRTLKERQLEQDIEEMKKQMRMLENELQRAAAMDGGADGTVDIPSNFDDAEFEDDSQNSSKHIGTVTAIQGKECTQSATAHKGGTAGGEPLDDDFPDSDGELLSDLVPPTPPRRGALWKELSFHRGKLH